MEPTFEVSLAQHTPIIHFQWDQPGATLRATELKPKLDKYLLSKEPNLPAKKSPNGSRFLDYKVSIQTNGKPMKDMPNKSLYFANAPIKDDNEKRRTLKSNSVSVQFFSLNPKILEAIKAHLCSFLAVTNFGTRQNKGYGGFYPEDPAVPFESAIASSSNAIYVYTYGGSWQKAVDSLHKELKAGINLKPTYKKSLLFQYMCQKGIRWEKRWIKKNFSSLPLKGRKPIDCDEPKKFHYVRALLGLAEHNEYRKFDKVTISDPNGQISRFKSPITYKVYRQKIYLLCDQSYKKILDKEFEFKYNGETRRLKTPESFDLEQFMDFACSKIGSLSRLKGAK